MTANKNLLRMKFARVIEAYAERSGCSLDEALDRFYRSNVYVEMRDGVSDMHCMSDEYLRVVVKGKNDLQSLFPDLCKEWDRAKNGELHPDQITPGKNGKVWWICPTCGHSYAAPPARRTRYGSGCRKCADKEITMPARKNSKIPR